MKTIIYIRTSTEEQNPQNQLRDCKTLLEKKDYEVVEDKQSAWKEHIEREGFNNIKKEISKGKVENLIVWDLDRIYRNRQNLIEFFTFCKLNNCRIESFRQQWLNKLKDIPQPFNEMMFDFMLQVMGWLAEEESKKKSERVKLAVVKKNGVTKSYKGNKWGRKAISKQATKKVLDLYNKGVPVREILKQVFYYDKHGNKKPIARATIYKLLKENKA
jgi:DNA invertase Pin-like site-specific DNA recombinase